MNAYWPIYFVPGATLLRFPVAALVRSERDTRVVIAQRLPDAVCMGEKATFLLRLELGELAEATTPDEVRARTGASVEVGPELPLAPHIRSPADWVQRHLLPSGSRQGAPTAKDPKEINRVAASRIFLRAHGVEDLVRPTFTPGKDLASLFEKDRLLPRIEQWVGDANRVVLMEPLAPALSSFAAHAQRTRTVLGSYREIIKRRSIPAELVAYVLSGRERDAVQRQQVVESLRQVATVYDVGIDGDCHAFISMVRETSRPGEALA